MNNDEKKEMFVGIVLGIILVTTVASLLGTLVAISVNDIETAVLGGYLTSALVFLMWMVHKFLMKK